MMVHIVAFKTKCYFTIKLSEPDIREQGVYYILSLRMKKHKNICKG